MVRPHGYLNAREEANFSFANDKISSFASKRYDEESRGILLYLVPLSVCYKVEPFAGITVYLFKSDKRSAGNIVPDGIVIT